MKSVHDPFLPTARMAAFSFARSSGDRIATKPPVDSRTPPSKPVTAISSPYRARSTNSSAAVFRSSFGSVDNIDDDASITSTVRSVPSARATPGAPTARRATRATASTSARASAR